MCSTTVGCSVLRAKRAGGTCTGTCFKTCATVTFKMSMALTHPLNLLSARSLAQLPGGILGATNGGQNLLHIAAAIDDASLVALALARGAPPSDMDANSMTPLHIAAQKGNLTALNALLRSGDARNAALVSGPDGETAIHKAAYYGRVCALRMFVSFLGREVLWYRNPKDRAFSADDSGSEDIVESDSDSEVETVREYTTPLDCAASSSLENIRTLSLLRNFGTTPDLTHEQEWVSVANIEYMRNWAKAKL